MARVRKSNLSFDAITLEGSLLSSAKFAAVAERKDRKGDEQEDADYSIPRGLTLRDETARYFRIGQALFRDLHASSTPSRRKTIEFTAELLRAVFGFPDVEVVHGPKVRDGRNFSVTLEALAGRVPVVVVSPSDDLDHASNSLSLDRRRSAASALQDWLNANERSLWGLCTNGESLRLLRDNESLTRPTYLEADLRQIFEGEDYAGFSALWLVLHASRFGRPGALPADCPLERWRESGSKEGLAARDRLRDGVETALLALGNGFLTNSANAELSSRLRGGGLSIDEYFRQLLRLVYRLIFLLAAEDRNLLHIPEASEAQRKLYSQGYSLGALRDRAIRRSGWDNFHDRWSGLKVTFRALANGEPRLGLPALGGIFATTATPELDKVQISNRYLMEAIFRLAWLRDDGLLMPVNWRDMETEELGSVYESLLELTPRLGLNGREFKFAYGTQTKGNARKTSGSYYTPDSLVQVLLDSALDPVLDRVASESEVPINSLLSVTVIDPACGSGHFLLAAARRIAKRIVRLRHGDIHTEQQRLAALRDVVRSCIHGVDRNPMAVELTKVALWIETVEPGKPLGFLDANIRLGDSLLGIFSMDALRKGIPDAAYKQLTGDHRLVAKDFREKNKDEIKGQARMTLTSPSDPPVLPKLAQSLRALRQLPEDTVAEIEAKRQRFDFATHDPRMQNLAQAADLYIAAFLTPKTLETAREVGTGLIPTTADVEIATRGGTVYGPRLGAARQLAAEARAFHWPLEFADTMSAGGFDVVLGNPPWERIKLQEQEFFAALAPEIAEAPDAAARGRLIEALQAAPAGSREHQLFTAFESAKRTAEAGSEFARLKETDGGRFPLAGRGDVNTYALFAEHFTRLASSRGRAGVVVPTGIATDAMTAPFFGWLIEERRLAQLIDFENRAGLFPAIDSRTKFSLLTTGQEIPLANFAFFLTDVSQLADSERRFTLSPEEIALVNPNTKTAPVFRSRYDAKLTAKIYAHARPLIDLGLGGQIGQAGNAWRLDVHSRFIHVSEDSGRFRKFSDLAEAGIRQNHWKIDIPVAQATKHTSSGAWFPLSEGEYGWIYDHRFATCEDEAVRAVAFAEHCDPSFEPQPRNWVHESFFEERLARRALRHRSHLLGFRRVSRNTDERTLIGTILPFMPSTYGWILLFTESARDSVALLSGMNSLVVDYAIRNKLSQPSIPQGTIYQLPVFPPTFYNSADFAFIVPRVLELTYTSNSLSTFALDLGYEGRPFPWDQDRRALLRAELDAWYARAYGLTRNELRYILDPADMMGPDYPSETFRVLKDKELRLYREYRTQRLVLDAWDRMEGGELHCPTPYDKTKASQPTTPSNPAFALTPPSVHPYRPGLNIDESESQ